MVELSSSNYSMPAEWARHDATWLAWPHNAETWPGNLDEARAEFTALVETIAEGEQVYLLCGGNEPMDSASKRFNGLANVELVDFRTNDAWIRDYGPTFAFQQDQIVGVDWNYNCWGEKYPPFNEDQQVATRVCDRLGIQRIHTDFIAEGGAIEVDGAGLMLATNCLLKRNQGTTKSDLENYFKNHLSVTDTIWLPADAVDGDDTDGHIDQIARFGNERTLFLTSDHGQMFRQNQNAIEEWSQSRREKFELVELPAPEPIKFQGRRIPASYTNFYFCNRGVIVPKFGDKMTDAIATDRIAAVVDREVIALDSLHLSFGLGSFHCLTQQQPAKKALERN